MSETVIYPRFLGVDSNADFVWELANGRWTWGDDPFQAATRQRTFTPDRYLEKYGPVEPQAPFVAELLAPSDQHTTGALEHIRNTVWTAELDEMVETRGTYPEPAYKLLGLIGHVRAIVGQPGAGVQLPPGSERTDKELVSRVLYALLVNLDGWIDGAHDNHEGMGHRGEARGEECWRQFAPGDIRTMINDVAREFGVSEFPRPDKGKEDTYR